MKKMITLVLAALLLLSMATPALGFSGAVSLTTSSAIVKHGDTFTVTASLSDAETLSLGTVKLDFNSDVFTLTGGTCHIPGVSVGEVLPDKKAGTFLLEGAPQRVSGPLFTFTFTVKEDAPYGKFTISSSSSLGVDFGESISSGSINVTLCPPGDVNGSGTLDNDDVLHLLWHTIYEESYGLCTDGDVNRDSEIDYHDVIYLLWHILFGDPYVLHK